MHLEKKKKTSTRLLLQIPAGNQSRKAPQVEMSRCFDWRRHGFRMIDAISGFSVLDLCEGGSMNTGSVECNAGAGPLCRIARWNIFGSPIGSGGQNTRLTSSPILAMMCGDAIPRRKRKELPAPYKLDASASNLR